MSDIGALLRDAVTAGDAAGAVAIALDDTGTTYLGAAGWRDREAGIAMSEDTVFYIASMTKAVTSVAAMQLVEQGSPARSSPRGPRFADPRVLAHYAELERAVYARAR